MDVHLFSTPSASSPYPACSGVFKGGEPAVTLGDDDFDRLS